MYARFKEHSVSLTRKTHTNEYLIRAWEKYGEVNFSFDVICECSKEELDAKEKYYIRLYNTINRDYGYNLEEGGRHGTHKSVETLQKMSVAGTKRTWSDEMKKHFSDIKKGKHHSEETKQKLRELRGGMLGKKHSEETKQKMRESRLKIFETEEGDRLKEIASKTHKGKIYKKSNQ